jgi:hypothetical protein
LVRRTQWLADSGYAVLSVNYRGSAGFGRAFIAASEKQHGAKMHDDLIDRVEWPSARATPDATKSSFFASLTGALHRFISATFTPDILLQRAGRRHESPHAARVHAAPVGRGH